MRTKLGIMVTLEALLDGATGHAKFNIFHTFI